MMEKRDLKASLDRLTSMANSPEREQCADTIHEIAIHNTERAIEAEESNKELLQALNDLALELIEIAPLSVMDFEATDEVGLVAFRRAAKILGREGVWEK